MNNRRQKGQTSDKFCGQRVLASEVKQTLKNAENIVLSHLVMVNNNLYDPWNCFLKGSNNMVWLRTIIIIPPLIIFIQISVVYCEEYLCLWIFVVAPFIFYIWLHFPHV